MRCFPKAFLNALKWDMLEKLEFIAASVKGGRIFGQNWAS
jgi:hypothetical protein